MAIIKDKLIKDVAIHIKVCKFLKSKGVIKAHTKFERDLKSCITKERSCRFAMTLLMKFFVSLQGDCTI